MPSYSHKRPASKGDIVPRLVRTSQNPISGQIEHVLLDRVQLAYEQMCREFDRLAMPMSLGEIERLAERVMLLGLEKMRHTDADKDAPLVALIMALANRVAIQSEMLSKKAGG
jgi:hypothetical protein